MADGALVMGDLVLTEPEIEPVMMKLLESGIDVTALHNHLLRAIPPTYYMHVHGHGDPVAMAAAIRAALAESRTPFGPPAAPATQAAQIELDTGSPGQCDWHEGEGQWRRLSVFRSAQGRRH